MVVGSFASGSDLARQLAGLNLADDQPKTKVYVSSSGDTSYATRDGDWAKYVIDVPIIRTVNGKRIELEDGEVVEDVDVVIFATGYYYSLPFCKRDDAPWDQVPVLDEELDTELLNGHTAADVASRNGHSADNGGATANGNESTNGNATRITNGHAKRGGGGIRGFHMDNLDPLLLFLRTDRTIAFPTLRTSHLSIPSIYHSLPQQLIVQNTRSSHSRWPKHKHAYSRSCGPDSYLPYPRQSTSTHLAIRRTRSPKLEATRPAKCARS